MKKTKILSYPFHRNVFHGTSTPIQAFDPAFMGQGDDQFGSGFYFSTSKSVASRYATGKNANIVKAHVSLEHPMVIDGILNSDLKNYRISGVDASMILRYNPDLYLQPDDETANPLGDYLPEFWDHRHYEKEEFDEMIDKLAFFFFDDTNFKELDWVFSRYPLAFHSAIREVFGYDGMVVDFHDDKHIIAWFPEQIHVLENIPYHPEPQERRSNDDWADKNCKTYQRKQTADASNHTQQHS